MNYVLDCPKFILGYKCLAPVRQLKYIRNEIQDLELETSVELFVTNKTVSP